MRYGSVVVAVNGKAKVARRNQEGRRENVPRSVFLCTCWGRERGEGGGSFSYPAREPRPKDCDKIKTLCCHARTHESPSYVQRTKEIMGLKYSAAFSLGIGMCIQAKEKTNKMKK